MQPFRLLRLSKSNASENPPFPLRRSSQNGPPCQGFAPPHPNGAPLTAPGRSGETLPYKRESRIGKIMTPIRYFTATPGTPCYISRRPHSGEGAGCRTFSWLPARRRAFSLDILFYRTKNERPGGEAEKRGLSKQRGAYLSRLRRLRHPR